MSSSSQQPGIIREENHLTEAQEKLARQKVYEAYFNDMTPEEIKADLQKEATLAEAERAKIMDEIKGKIALLQNDNKDEETRMDEEIEKMEYLKKILLQKQYTQMLKVLGHYEIDTTGAPSQKAVEKGLTDEVLKKAMKLKKPTLLLIPPTTRQSKVEAINRHPAKGQIDTYIFRSEDDNLWNGGNAETGKKWRVSIVEGAQDIPKDKNICNGKRRNYKICKLWVKKYEDQGLDVMNDVDAYLTLMMKGISEGQPVDLKTYTALNTKNLTKSPVVARGRWSGDRVVLDYDNPHASSVNLRMRALVEVDVAQA